MLTKAMLTLVASGQATTRVKTNAATGRVVSIEFQDALEGFEEKFRDYPCLTVPRIIRIQDAGRVVEFSVLIKNVAPIFDRFDPRCGKDAASADRPMFWYVDHPHSQAFSDQRFVLATGNTVFSIPYSITDVDIKKTNFMATAEQMRAVLQKVKVSSELQARVDFELNSLLNKRPK
jgi:hypothetical protein